MSRSSVVTVFRRVSVLVLTAVLACPTLLFAQSPWERAASNLERTFTGPLARSLALVAIVIGGLMFMFGEGGREAPDLRHRVRRRAGALRRAVPRLVVLNRSGTTSCRGRCGHAQSPDVPSRLQGAPSSADGLRRRPPSVLPVAAARRRHVQPLLLVPGRPADVRRPLRLRALGDAHAIPRCSAFCSRRRRRRRRYDPGKHDPRRPGGAIMVTHPPHPPRLRESGSVNSCSPSGASSTTRRSSPRPATSASSIACRASTSKGCLTHQRTPSSTASKRRLRLLDEPCRVYQYLIKRSSRRSSPAPCRQPVAHEAIQRRAAYLNAAATSCSSSNCISSSSTKRRTSPRRSTSLRGAVAHPREALRAWLSTDAHRSACWRPSSTRGRDAAPQGVSLRGPAQRRSARASAEGRRLSVLPAARELRPARRGRRPLTLRHASRLLRRRLRRRVPPRSPAWSVAAREGADDEGAAEPDVRRILLRTCTPCPASSSPVSSGSAFRATACGATSRPADGISSTSACRW